MLILWLSRVLMNTTSMGHMEPYGLVFMSTFVNQTMSIGCVGKLWHLFGFLRHYLLIVCVSKNHPFGGTWSVSDCIDSCLDMFRMYSQTPLIRPSLIRLNDSPAKNGLEQNSQ